MRRLKASLTKTANDCSSIIEDFLKKHIKHYTIEHFNANTVDNQTFINALIKSNDIYIAINFTCENNNIVDYEIFVNADNASIESAKEVCDINNKANKYLEEVL